MNPQDNALQAFAKATGDAKIDTNEMTSILIAKYETDLHGRKEELRDTIKELIEKNRQLNESVMDNIDTTKYTLNLPLHGLTVSANTNNIDWRGNPVEGIRPHVTVLISATVVSNPQNPFRINTVKELVTEFDVQLHNDLVAQQSTAEGQLQEILLAITNLGRRERQFRGELAKMKLNALGAGDLLKDPALQGLLQIPV